MSELKKFLKAVTDKLFTSWPCQNVPGNMSEKAYLFWRGWFKCGRVFVRTCDIHETKWAMD